MSKKTKDPKVYFYSEQEENLNIVSHGIGFLASIFGTFLLLEKSYPFEVPKNLMSYVIYACSLMILFGASTFYHSAKDMKLRRRLNIVDHAAIFVLIAGSYTPFALITLGGTIGWTVFISVWIFALIGMMLKIFYTGRFEKLSTGMYVAMGWMILFVINPLSAVLPGPALYLLFAGGVLYTVGALFYLSRMKFNHAVFHLFVLAGALSHFLAIYLYV